MNPINPMIFGKFNQTQTQLLLKRAIRKRFNRGQIVYSPFEPFTKTTYIVRGNLVLVRNLTDGREIVIRRLSMGDSLGEIASRSATNYPGWLRAETDVEILEICHTTIIELCQNSDFLSAYLDGIADRTRYLVSRLTLMAIQPIERRLAHFLIDEPVDAKPIESITKLAALLGCTRETLSRVLHSFVIAGLIELQRKMIIIKDRVGLESVIDM